MSDDLLKSKIELLKEQIDNLEKSGFFTEKEMDKYSFLLRNEIEAYESQLHRDEINVVDAQILTPNHQEA
jgi:hypothetical protein